MESWLVERKQCLQVLKNAHGFKKIHVLNRFHINDQSVGFRTGRKTRQTEKLHSVTVVVVSI